MPAEPWRERAKLLVRDQTSHGTQSTHLAKRSKPPRRRRVQPIRRSPKLPSSSDARPTGHATPHSVPGRRSTRRPIAKPCPGSRLRLAERSKACAGDSRLRRASRAEAVFSRRGDIRSTQSICRGGSALSGARRGEVATRLVRVLPRRFPPGDLHIRDRAPAPTDVGRSLQRPGMESARGWPLPACSRRVRVRAGPKSGLRRKRTAIAGARERW